MHVQQDYRAGDPTLWVARLSLNPVVKQKHLLATQEPLCDVEARADAGRTGSRCKRSLTTAGVPPHLSRPVVPLWVSVESPLPGQRFSLPGR